MKKLILLLLTLVFVGGAFALTKPCTQPGCDDHDGDFRFNDDLTVTGDLKVIGRAYADWSADPPKTTVSTFDVVDEWTIANELTTVIIDATTLNGDFEDFTGADCESTGAVCIPDNWRQGPANPANVTVHQSTEQVHGGTYSAKIGINAASGNIQTADADVFTVVAGQAYEFIGWIYGDATNEIYSKLTYGTTTHMILGTTTGNGEKLPASWTKIRFPFIAQENAADGYILFQQTTDAPTGTNTFYLDDFSLNVAAVPVDMPSDDWSTDDHDPRQGNYALHFSNAGNTAVTLTKTGAWDFSRHHFWLKLLREDNTQFDSVKLKFSDGTNTAEDTLQLLEDDGWLSLNLSRNMMDSTDTEGSGEDWDINWSAITSIILTFDNVDGQTFQAGLDDFVAYETFPFSFLTFWADDFYDTKYSIMKPAIEKHNMKMVVAIWGNNIGIDSTKITTEQLGIMNDRGHDIISHSWSHPHFGTGSLTVAQARYQFLKSKRFLQSDPIRATKGSRFFGWPYGTVDEWTMAQLTEAKKHFKMVSATFPGDLLNPLPLPDLYNLARTEVPITLTNAELATLKLGINDLVRYGGWKIDYAHQFTADDNTSATDFDSSCNNSDGETACCSDTQYVYRGDCESNGETWVKHQNLDEYLTYLESNNIIVITLSDMYDYILTNGRYDQETYENYFPLVTPAIVAATTLAPSDAGTIAVDLDNGDSITSDYAITLPDCAGNSGLEYTVWVETADDGADCGGSACKVTFTVDGGEAIVPAIEDDMDTVNDLIILECDGIVTWLKKEDTT